MNRLAQAAGAAVTRALNDTRCAVVLGALYADPWKLDDSARRVKVKELDAKWAELEAARCRLGPKSYGAAVLILTRYGFIDRARALWEEMRARKVHPTIDTYAQMLAAEANTGDATRAREVFDAMKADGHTPTTRCYNALIRLHAARGDDDKVAELAAEMERLKVGKNEHTYAHLARMGAVGAAGTTTRALNDMRCAVVLNSLSTDPRSLDDQGKRNKVREFYNKWRELEAARCRLGPESYGSAVALLTRFGYVDKAREMWEEMRARKVHPTAGSFSQMLTAEAKAGDLERALKVWREMKADGHRPTTRCYNSMMHLFVTRGEYERVSQLADGMERDRVVKNEHTCSHLLRSARGWEGFKRALDQILREGLTPTTVNMNAALRGASPDVDLCDRIMTYLRQNLDVETNITTYNTLISCYRAGNAHDRAVALIPRIPHVFTSYTYNQLLFCCAELTTAVGDKHWKLGEALSAHAWAAEEFTHRTALAAVTLYLKHGEVDRAMRVVSSVRLGGSQTMKLIAERVAAACKKKGEPVPPAMSQHLPGYRGPGQVAARRRPSADRGDATADG